jgi:hypothetical protein
VPSILAGQKTFAGVRGEDSRDLACESWLFR